MRKTASSIGRALRTAWHWAWRRQRGNAGKAARGGLAAALIAVPAIGTLTTFYLYLRSDTLKLERGDVVFLGVVSGLALWLLIALYLSFNASALGANRLAYAQLKSRLDRINHDCDRLLGHVPAPPIPVVSTGVTLQVMRAIEGYTGLSLAWARLAEPPVTVPHPDAELLKTIRSEVHETLEALHRPDTGWLTGEGFIAAWARVHHIEEELMPLLSRDRLTEEALYDLARIARSGIEQEVELVARQRAALTDLEPCLESVVGRDATRTVCGEVELREQIARIVITNSRRAVNQFRDDRWATLMRQKQVYLTAALSLTIGIYLMTILAVTQQVSETTLIGVLVFFAIGAMVGLFAQLVVSPDSGLIAEDYGYTRARQAFTPLVSGLAAVMGVWLWANGVTLTDATKADDAATGGATESVVVELKTLDDAYNFNENRAALVIAAAFGIAPATVIGRINQSALQAKRDLKASDGITTSG